jgi:hypothetical protein
MISSPRSSVVLSELYLEAVLPCLTTLAEHDPLARELIGAKEASIVLRVIRGPATTVHLRRGEVLCAMAGTRNPSVVLLFLNRAHLNAFFAGHKWAVPVPVWGGWRVGLLKRFATLAQRLEAVLNGHKSVIDDPSGRRLYARLSLVAATLGLRALLRGDAPTLAALHSVPLGLACFSIEGEDGASAWFDHRTSASVSTAGWGEPPRRPEVCIAFRNVEIAFLAMRDEIDSIAAVGLGDIKIDGLVPLADGLNSAMQRLRIYLGP